MPEVKEAGPIHRSSLMITYAAAQPPLQLPTFLSSLPVPRRRLKERSPDRLGPRLNRSRPGFGR
jgi:hypothetical protein